jgi:hypothetical protein
LARRTKPYVQYKFVVNICRLLYKTSENINYLIPFHMLNFILKEKRTFWH